MNRNGIHGLDIAIALAVITSYAVSYLLWSWTWDELFWDFDVYQRAVADLTLGYDPYRRNVALPFLYHPAVLYALLLLDRFIGLHLAFAGLYIAALLVFVRGCRCLWQQGAPLRQFGAPDQMLMVIAAFACCGAGVLTVIAGNVTLYLHLALIGSALIYLDGRRTSARLLMLAVLFISLLVKPYFLLYVLPLLVVERFSLRSTALLAAPILLAVAVYALFWMFDRTHSLQFFNVLKVHLDAGADLGASIYGLSANFLSMASAFKLHLALSAVLVIAALLSRRLTAAVVPAGTSDGAVFLLAYGIVTLCNPRMKEYDLVPALVCFYLYFSAGGWWGRALVLLSLVVAQIPLWSIWRGAAERTLADLLLVAWAEWLAVVLPLLLFFAGALYRGASSRRAAGVVTQVAAKPS